MSASAPQIHPPSSGPMSSTTAGRNMASPENMKTARRNASPQPTQPSKYSGDVDLPSRIGSFSLLSLDPCGAATTPLIYRQREETFPSRTTQLRHGSYLRKFSQGPVLDLSQVSIKSGPRGLDEFMRQYGLTGFLVVQNGAIRVEEYRHGNHPAARNDIQSVTKLFLSTSLAIAIQEGRISIDDKVSDHVEELRGTAWEDVPLMALISMSSGVVEPSDPHETELFDFYTLNEPDAVLNWLKTFVKEAEPWEKYYYYNPNYYVLSTAITRAIQEPLQDYITRHIWDPAGMKYDGYIRTTAAGQVDCHGGLSITLTDMARFGSFVLDGLKGRGGPAVPPGWFEAIAEAKDSSTGPRAVGANGDAPGFGYEAAWWTPARGGETYQLGDDRTMAGFGQHGQALYVIPQLETVIAIQSGHPEYYAEQFVASAEFAVAVVQALRQES